MSDPEVITLENIRDFMISKGGKVSNHELVKHFKNALTNQDTSGSARVLFKELVNAVATITRDQDGTKQLVLKKKYRTSVASTSDTEGYSTTLAPLSLSPEVPLNLSYTPVYQTSNDSAVISESLGSPLSLKNFPVYNVETTQNSSRRTSSHKTPSEGSSSDSYLSGAKTSLSSSLDFSTPSVSSRKLPSDYNRRGSISSESAVSANVKSSDDTLYGIPATKTYVIPTKYQRVKRSTSRESMRDFVDSPPPVPPRRKSVDKYSVDSSSTVISSDFLEPSYQNQYYDDTASLQSAQIDKENVANVSKISVKERSQKFDRMASESALNKLTVHNVNVGHKKKHDKTDKDDEDTGSVQLLDSKTREWLVKCAQGDYQAIVKLAAENPKLVKFKDPTSGYTALHWGAKHGNLDIIKLIAGSHKADVNARTNGGYTPLHLATQFGHEEACTQLVKVYKADENLRDYSGRKPRQYQKTSGTSISADTYRKIKARKKHAAEKDLGFLRIGSLNVRVKKTTEAFSNFLGVGNAEKLHKHWGSADNLPQGDNKRMPPPKMAPIKKRKSKRAQDFITKPTVIEHHPAAPLNESNTQQDSDSDTAAGFGLTWQSTV